jgi:hypothetical protein
MIEKGSAVWRFTENTGDHTPSLKLGASDFEKYSAPISH